MIDTTAIEVSVADGVGRLTLARPQKLNALNRAALEELAGAATWFNEHPDVKVVVVAGQGRAFCAGFDLADRRWAELGPPEMSAATGRAMAEAIRGMTAITIAAVHGHCVGGGVVLAAACDLRLAALGARFRIPEVDLGIPLYWTGVPLLARELGAAVTKELVLTGRAFDADEAHRIRFVNRVVTDEALASQVDGLATALAAKAALVLRVTKQQVDRATPPVLEGDGGVEGDVAGNAAAFADPESLKAASTYRAARVNRSR